MFGKNLHWFVKITRVFNFKLEIFEKNSQNCPKIAQKFFQQMLSPLGGPLGKKIGPSPWGSRKYFTLKTKPLASWGILKWKTNVLSLSAKRFHLSHTFGWQSELSLTSLSSFECRDDLIDRYLLFNNKKRELKFFFVFQFWAKVLFSRFQHKIFTITQRRS